MRKGYFDTDDLIDVVEEINDELDLKHDSFPFRLVFRTNGTIFEISMGEVSLWDSESDKREYVGELEDPEPIREYIKAQFNKLLETFTTVRIEE